MLDGRIPCILAGSPLCLCWRQPLGRAGSSSSTTRYVAFELPVFWASIQTLKLLGSIASCFCKSCAACVLTFVGAQSYVILRQQYLMGGEQQINEWHRHFLEKRMNSTLSKEDAFGMRSRPSGTHALLNNLNPRMQVPWALDLRTDSHFCKSNPEEWRKGS